MHRSLQPRQRIVQADDGPLTARSPRLRTRPARAGGRPWSAQIVALAVAADVFQARREGARRRPRRTPAGSVRRGSRAAHRRKPRAAREQIEKAVAASEDDRGPEDRPRQPRVAHDALGFALRSQVPAGPCRIGVERAHVQEPAYAPRRQASTTLRASSTCACSKLCAAAAVVQHADQVDRGVRAVEERRERRGIVHVGVGHVHGGQQDQLHLGALPVAGRHRTR